MSRVASEHRVRRGACALVDAGRSVKHAIQGQLPPAGTSARYDLSSAGNARREYSVIRGKPGSATGISVGRNGRSPEGKKAFSARRTCKVHSHAPQWSFMN